MCSFLVPGRPAMAVALLFTPASMTVEQYDRVTTLLKASGSDAPPGRRFHACFGPAGHLTVFEVWDSVDELETFGATILPLLANEQVAMAPAEPLEIHGLIEEGDASALRTTIVALREQAFSGARSTSSGRRSTRRGSPWTENPNGRTATR
jgi:hypothetical protein